MREPQITQNKEHPLHARASDYTESMRTLCMQEPQITQNKEHPLHARASDYTE